MSADGAQSGSVSVSTGAAQGGTSGSLSILSGNAQGGSAGAVSVAVGASDVGAGGSATVSLAAPLLRVVLVAMCFSLVVAAAKWVALSPSAVVARTLERRAMFCFPAVICKCMLVPALQAVALYHYRLVLATLAAVCRFRRLHRRKPQAEMWLFLRQIAPVAVVVSLLAQDPHQLAQVVRCNSRQAHRQVAQQEMSACLSAPAPQELEALLP